MSNLNVIVSANLILQDLLSSTTPINRNWGNPTLAGTQIFFDAFFQAATAGSVPQLPGVCFVVYVQNLSTTNNLRVLFTPNAGTATSLIFGPNGVFFYMDPSEGVATNEGITNLELFGIGGTVSAYVLAGF